MGTYAITGSASGMGRETAHRLRSEGHTVIGVDVKDAGVTADLSAPHGRQKAADAVLAASAGKLDGAVLAAGLGPGPSPDRPRQIAQVTYLGVVELLAALATGAGCRGTRQGRRRRQQLHHDSPHGPRPNRAGAACA
jgi:NAD(P)-dependent dehydrogenase (short-subunit alcohol dehydrogenase family)